MKHLPILATALALLLSAAVMAERPVTDAWDRTVALDEPARRIVALAPHITENVYSAGAGERLVAAVEYSDYPAEALELPRVGSFQAVDMERLLALEPDLVLVWGSNQGERLTRQLEELGLTYFVDEPRRMEDVADSVRAIGILAGTTEHAERAAADYLAGLSELRERYGAREPIGVLYQIWHEPLQTLSGEHLVSDVIRLCGGRNLYADAASLAPVINRESVLERNPQAIVASGPDGTRPQWLDDWQRWPSLSAVQHDNLFVVHPDLIQRHTLRILDGARAFCAHLDTARDNLDGGSAAQ